MNAQVYTCIDRLRNHLTRVLLIPHLFHRSPLWTLSFSPQNILIACLISLFSLSWMLGVVMN